MELGPFIVFFLISKYRLLPKVLARLPQNLKITLLKCFCDVAKRQCTFTTYKAVLNELGLRGIYVNFSIMDEGAPIRKQVSQKVDSRFISIGLRQTNLGYVMLFPESKHPKIVLYNKRHCVFTFAMEEFT